MILYYYYTDDCVYCVNVVQNALMHICVGYYRSVLLYCNRFRRSTLREMTSAVGTEFTLLIAFGLANKRSGSRGVRGRRGRGEGRARRDIYRRFMCGKRGS